MRVLETAVVNYSPVSLTAVAITALSISYIIYRTYFDALSHIPGPLICRLTNLWAWTHSWLGDESRQIDRLHKIYGPVVRIAPNEVVFSEGDALGPIYAERGGFLKAPCYRNFDSEGHETIFSTLSPQHRAVRSKAVMPVFSTANIRSRQEDIEGCVNNFVDRLKKEAEKSRKAKEATGIASPVDVLNLSRGLAIDSVCAYLFGKDYGGVHEEDQPELSASLYVDSVVAFGRFFFLPPWLFVPIYTFLSWLNPPSKAELASAEKVNSFTSPLVTKSPREDTYQTRLIKAGCSNHEADVQMKDVIFAGTDTTGTNFASLLFHLARNPDVYKKLRDEILTSEQEDPDYNPQNLKYLDSVLRESLRLSMANPTRFPRVVPPSGFTYSSPATQKSYFLPNGTIVGLQPWTLHHDLSVFEDPFVFRPERWAEPTKAMLRDFIPFGLGSRMCIARNLAMFELCLATRAVVRSGVLENAKTVRERIEVVEWFNAKVVGGRIELVW
ncbi:Cytochrome P450 monooxygenase [Pseudocercospora fuligena]|uniref:Cytochrome P450 monooxygenase n=1 Tax=Pseudocercospora fuligena TaxID=685502 RepID=A0A8H6R961_9PEZI|nr:Cytochrome P450 monooxygenase [Pseudocercospora fuligena]